MNSLSDIMSASGLHVYAEVALVLFLIAFATIVTQVFTARQSTWDRAARLPLDDEPVAPTSTRERES
jgi:hypothetical protein